MMFDGESRNQFLPVVYTALWSYYQSLEDGFMDMGQKKALYYLEKCYHIHLLQYGKYHSYTLSNSLALSKMKMTMNQERDALKLMEDAYNIAQNIRQLDEDIQKQYYGAKAQLDKSLSYEERMEFT